MRSLGDEWSGLAFSLFPLCLSFFFQGVLWFFLCVRFLLVFFLAHEMPPWYELFSLYCILQNMSTPSSIAPAHILHSILKVLMAPNGADCCGVLLPLWSHGKVEETRMMWTAQYAYECKSHIPHMPWSFGCACRAPYPHTMSLPRASRICRPSDLPRGIRHPLHGRSYCTPNIVSSCCFPYFPPLSCKGCRLRVYIYLTTGVIIDFMGKTQQNR